MNVAGKKRRTIRVDKKVWERIQASQAKDEEKAKAKEEAMKEAYEADIPNDGIDHARWPPEARKLALLMVDPANAGKTQAELGEMCGYSLRSVQRYQAMPEFQRYVSQLADRIYNEKAFPLFVRAMLRGLERGDAKFVELYMKSKGMLKDVKKVESDVNINDRRSDALDDIQAEIERLRREVGMDAGEVKH